MILKYNTELLKSITNDELNEVGQYLLDTSFGNPDIKALKTNITLAPDESILTFFVNWSIDGVESNENWKSVTLFSLTQINHLIEKGIVYVP